MEPSGHNDRLLNELFVGNEIVFLHYSPYRNKLLDAIITGFTPKSILVKYRYNEDDEYTFPGNTYDDECFRKDVDHG
jgi:hypothetical protein